MKGKDPPLITVVTVVRNGVSVIEDTIKSVLQQSYENLEYVIVDGGSTDGTIDVIRSHQSRLIRWVSEPDEGIYHAMNKGWSFAKDHSFILFLGAGDRLVSLPDLMDTYGIDEVIYGKVQLENNLLFRSKHSFHLKVYNTLHHQALLINKAFHTAQPFDTRYHVYADFDFNQRLYKMGAKFRYSDKFLAYASPSGISARFNLIETLRIVTKNFGPLWGMVTLSAFLVVKFVPGIKKLRPISRIS